MKGDKPKKIDTLLCSTEKRISGIENMVYHLTLKVYWKTKAWSCRKLNMKYTETHLVYISDEQQLNPETGARENFLIFYNSLDEKNKNIYKQTRKEKSNANLNYYVENQIDKLAPVDDVFGANLEHEYGKRLEKWLWEDDSSEIWDSGKISASKFQIILTHKVIACLDMVNLKEITHWRKFTKRGCSITENGEDNYLIHP